MEFCGPICFRATIRAPQAGRLKGGVCAIQQPARLAQPKISTVDALHRPYFLAAPPAERVERRQKRRAVSISKQPPKFLSLLSPQTVVRKILPT